MPSRFVQERRQAVDALSSNMQRLQGQLEAARAEAAAGKQHAEELQRRLGKAQAAAASHPLPPHEVTPIHKLHLRLHPLSMHSPALQPGLLSCCGRSVGQDQS
jgi:hypothetical protein